MKKLIIITLLTCLTNILTQAQNLELVKDINITTEPGVRPHYPITIGNITYYSRCGEGDDSDGIFRTDGTSSGTFRIYAKPPNFNCYNFLLKSLNNDLIFVDNSKLYKTIGNLNSEILIKDFGNQIVNIESVGNKIYTFIIANLGGELWVSDGTVTGNLKIRDFSEYEFQSMYSFNNYLFFTKRNKITSRIEIWKSDGTVSGTTLFFTSPTVESGIFCKAVNSQLYFSTKFNTTNHGLWKSDGTVGGTVLIKSDFSDYITSFFDAGAGIVYFTGNGLWRTDGTMFGTYRISPIGCQPDGQYTFAKSGNFTIFQGYDSSNRYEPWKTDGTAEGTNLIKDIQPNFLGGSSDPNSFFSYNGYVYFIASTFTTNSEDASITFLYKTDGTTDGTEVVKEFKSISTIGDETGFAFFIHNNYLFFHANDGLFGDELWKTDGTTAGTVLVKDIQISTESSVNGINLHKSGSKIYFSGNNGINGRELWASDGTGAGTIMLSDYNNPSTTRNESTDPRSFIDFDNKLVYINYASSVFSQQIYVSDGISSGLLHINGNPQNSFPVTHNLVKMNNYVYFRNENSLKRTNLTVLETIKNLYISSEIVALNNLIFFLGSETYSGNKQLWRSDGTEAGTFPLTSATDYAISLQIALGKIYFNLSDANDKPIGLYKTDGSLAGTEVVKAGRFSVGLDPSNLKSFTTTHFFFNGTERNEFNSIISQGAYATNGTDAGTIKINDFGLQDLIIIGNLAYFRGQLHEIYKSDGTIAGTSILTPPFSVGRPTHSFNQKLLIEVDFLSDFSDVKETWISDGTSSGTIKIADHGIVYGFQYNGLFYFSARDLSGKYYFYKTDGTAAGTIKLKDFFRIDESIVEKDGSAFFFADDSIHGFELWKLTAESPCPISLPISSNYSTQTITHQASAINGLITATNQITNTAKIAYQSKAILLSTGFKAEPISGGYFKAEIGGCN